MTGTEYLEQLQREASKSGYHKKLKMWVDNDSSVAKALRLYDEVVDTTEPSSV